MHCVTFSALVAQILLLTSTAVADEATSTSTTTITRTVAFATSTATTSRPNTTTTGTAQTGASEPTPAGSTMPSGGSYSSSELRVSVLNSTNYYRAQFLAIPLNWDSKLAAYAQAYSQKCLWEHSAGPYGENLALGFKTPTLGIDAWAAEEKKYRYPNEGFSEDTGHFTQLVWQNTTHVGCGATNCNNDAANGAKGWFLVCEYNPPGNVDGQYQWNVQKPGESEDGKLGFGVLSAASSSSTCSQLLVALVALSSLASMLL